jgi:hypothetical protein
MSISDQIAFSETRPRYNIMLHSLTQRRVLFKQLSHVQSNHVFLHASSNGVVRLVTMRSFPECLNGRSMRCQLSRSRCCTIRLIVQLGFYSLPFERLLFVLEFMMYTATTIYRAYTSQPACLYTIPVHSPLYLHLLPLSYISQLHLTSHSSLTPRRSEP